ncbi:MAG: glycosyltransferase [Clostridiales Family XIII bacterium]|nr:glycosyltransferase [Clostridiales Family XIII bacterium]
MTFSAENDIKISIIIPVYNQEVAIARCLDSAISQTISEIEILVIDDGSTDGSPEIIDDYARRYPSKIVAIHTENGGVAAARNMGLSEARGRYIGFLDGDDYLAADMYEKLHCAMSAKGGQGVQLATCRRYSVMNGKHVEKFFPKIFLEDTLGKGGVFEVDTDTKRGELLQDISVFIWDKLFDAEIIRSTELSFPLGQPYGEDFTFLAKYLYYVKAAVFVDEPLYYYNAFSSGSFTNSISGNWYNIYRNLSDVIAYYKEKGLWDSVGPYLESVCIRYYDRRANAMFLYGGKKFQMRYVNYSFEFLSENFPDWKARVRVMDGILMAFVKISPMLMKFYILTPNFIKRAFAGRILQDRGIEL